MFFSKKSPRSYVGLYHKFLYKIFIITDPPPPPPQNILLTPPSMRRRLHLSQGLQCSVLFKKLHLSTVVSAYFPNDLPTQQLENICVTHQSQLTCRGLSYKDVLFYSATVPGENFHCAKIFAVVQEEDPDKGLFDKEPALPPPEIHNLTAPPSAPGDPIEAGILNAYNR